MSNDHSDWVHFHASGQRNPHFGEVQYRILNDGRKEVKLIIKPSEGLGFELACAALAIDGSRSMMPLFGAHLPPFLRKANNKMQHTINALASFLAKNAQGKIAMTYWACGADGGEIEPIGMLNINDLDSQVFGGPANWGGGTQITPIVRFFWESVFSTITGQSFALIITDGAWGDEDQASLIELTDLMCNEIAAGNRHPVKFVILALETEKNRGDIEQIQARFTALDDYEHPTGIDIWDHKWEKELEETTDLFVEMVQENYLNCPGRVVADGVECFESDNLKFGLEFILPATAKGFTLQLMISDEPLEMYQSLEV